MSCCLIPLNAHPLGMVRLLLSIVNICSICTWIWKLTFYLFYHSKSPFSRLFDYLGEYVWNFFQASSAFSKSKLTIWLLKPLMMFFRNHVRTVTKWHVFRTRLGRVCSGLNDFFEEPPLGQTKETILQRNSEIWITSPNVFSIFLRTITLILDLYGFVLKVIVFQFLPW